MLRTTLFLACFCLTFAPLAEAGHKYRRARCQPVNALYSYQPPVVTASQPTPALAGVGSCDPGIFCAWLNAHRARYGIGPVGYDQALAVDASASNAAMRSKGFNHHWGNAPAQKNIGMGPMSTIQSMWIASPPHNAWLLRATVVGIAYDGYYATMSAR